jgi:hypothetical protein
MKHGFLMFVKKIIQVNIFAVEEPNPKEHPILALRKVGRVVGYPISSLSRYFERNRCKILQIVGNREVKIDLMEELFLFRSG